MSRGDYPDGKLLLDSLLKKELKNNDNIALRAALSTNYGKAFMIISEDKRDINPKNLFRDTFCTGNT